VDNDFCFRAALIALFFRTEEIAIGAAAPLPIKEAGNDEGHSDKPEGS
jgi:hypothetical protein